MPETIEKRRWTRAEKWLLGAPLLILAAAVLLPYAREVARRKMGLPARVIPIAGKDFLMLFSLSPHGEFVVGHSENPSLQFYDARSGNLTKELQMSPPAPGQWPNSAVPFGLDFSSKSHQVALGFAGKPIEI